MKLEVRNSFSLRLILLVLCSGITRETQHLSAHCRANEGLIKGRGASPGSVVLHPSVTQICNFSCDFGHIYRVSLDFKPVYLTFVGEFPKCLETFTKICKLLA